jgi:hypothetical protein
MDTDILTRILNVVQQKNDIRRENKEAMEQITEV